MVVVVVVVVAEEGTVVGFLARENWGYQHSGYENSSRSRGDLDLVVVVQYNAGGLLLASWLVGLGLMGAGGRLTERLTEWYRKIR